MRVWKFAEVASLFCVLILLGLFFNQAKPEVASQFANGVTGIFTAGGDASVAPDPEEADAPLEESTPVEQANVDDNGFELDHFDVHEAPISRGQTFADLLTDAGVPYSEVHSLVNEVSSDFDVTRLRAGRAYQIYEDKWLDKPRYFVYQTSRVRYVTIDLLDKSVEMHERPVEIVEREAEGTIARSLYQTVRESGAPYSLIYRLADMYAWQVDFHRVQPGDNFHVIYEEERIGDEVIGVRNILAGRFEHRGQENIGIYFDNGEQRGHFDENGESLERMLLQAPLQYTRISSGYQENRRHPVTGQNRPHRGTDYAAPHGTPIHSVGDGTIETASYSRGNGNYVRVRHNATYTTQYLHMSRFADGISPGTRVKQGEVIGYVGSTGLATGPHVCFRFWKNGRQVDHRQLDMPPSEPIEDKFRDEFFQVAEELIPDISSNPSLLAEYSQRERRTTYPNGATR